MTDYTTLNIINKLLLEKLERLENENKELKDDYEKLQIKARTDYNELYTLKCCVDLSDVVCCKDCIGQMWYHYDDMTMVGDNYVCENCYDNNGYFNCECCGDCFEEDEQSTIDDICKDCFEEELTNSS